MKTPSSPTKLVLLPYQALGKRWLTPALLLIPAGIALWIAAPSIPGLNPELAPAALIISLMGALIAAYALLAKSASIRFGPSSFKVRTPLYPVAFSYARVEMVRPVEFRTIFPPESMKSAQLRLYESLLGKTAVVVQLKSFPLPIGWLKLWFHPLLLHPKERALVLLVGDWMSLSRGLESHRTQWREASSRRRQARE